MATTKKVTDKKVTKKTTEKKTPTLEASKKEENVFSKITRIVMQLCVAIVAIVAVFSPENTWVLGPIIGALSIMGIALGYFASK